MESVNVRLPPEAVDDLDEKVENDIYLQNRSEAIRTAVLDYLYGGDDD